MADEQNATPTPVGAFQPDTEQQSGPQVTPDQMRPQAASKPQPVGPFHSDSEPAKPTGQFQEEQQPGFLSRLFSKESITGPGTLIGQVKDWAAEAHHIVPGSAAERFVQQMDPRFKGTAPVPEMETYKRHPANLMYRDIRERETPDAVGARQRAAAMVSGAPGLAEAPPVDVAQAIDKNQHPMLKALAEQGQSILSPANIGIMIGTGGLGMVANAGRLGVGNALAGLFAVQSIAQAYKHFESFREAYDSGDVNEALYQFTHLVASGAITAAATADAAGQPLKTLSEGDVAVAKKGAELAGKGAELAGKGVKAAVSAVTTPVQALGKMAGFGESFEEAARKYSPPTPKAAAEGYTEKLTSVAPLLRDILNRDPNSANWEPNDFVDAIEKRRKGIESQLMSQAASIKGTPEAQMPGIMNEVNDVLNEFFEKEGARYKPAEQIKAKEEISNFLMQEGGAGAPIVNLEGRNLTEPEIWDVEKIRQRFNDDTRPMFGADPGDVPPAVMAGKKAVADYLRKALDEKYGQLGIQGVKEWRSKEADLIDVRDNLARAQKRAEELGNFSTVKSAIARYSWPLVLLALGHGEVAMAAEAANIARDYVVDRTKNPNTIIKRLSSKAAKQGVGGDTAEPRFGQAPSNVPTPKGVLPAEFEEPHIEDTPRGMDTKAVLNHELGHVKVANDMGFSPRDVISREHPDSPGGGRIATTRLDWGPDLDKLPDGSLPKEAAQSKLNAILATHLAGAAANELYDNIPYKDNSALVSDIGAVHEFLNELGVPEKEHDNYIQAALDTAKSHLEDEHTTNTINEFSDTREPHLPDTHHYSAGRILEFLDKVGGGKHAGDTARIDEGINKYGERPEPGREGEVAGRATLEPAAAGVRVPEERAARAGLAAEATPSMKQLVSKTPWGEDKNTGYRKLVIAGDEGKIGELQYAGSPGDYSARIRKSFIEPEYRNQGIAKEMYKSAIEDAKKRGIEVFKSDTVVSPDAQRVWESLLSEGKYPVKKMTQYGGDVEYHVRLKPEPTEARRVLPPERSVTPEADKIIKAAGAIPGGMQKWNEEGIPDYATFHDPTSGSTLSVPMPELSESAVKAELEKSRAQYRAAAERKAKNEGFVSDGANAYNKAQGLPPINPEHVEEDPRSSDVADAYKAAVHAPNDPAVKKSYEVLKDDVDRQWDFATKNLGIKVDTSDTNPYGLSKDIPAAQELHDDVLKNKHLTVWLGGAPPADHPLSEVDPKTGLTYNTKFRAVHDIFGHAAEKADFSPAGEETAWNLHRQMFSPEALPALATETKGQAAYTYKYGDFPPQKAAILPKEFQVRPEDLGTTLHENVVKAIASQDSGALDPATGESDPTGRGLHGIEIFPESKVRFAERPTEADVDKFHKENQALFDKYSALRLGWDYDPGNHPDEPWELNIGAAGTPEGAKFVGNRLDQRAAYDIDKGEVVPLRGKNKQTSFPDYPLEQRLEDLKRGTLPQDLESQEAFRREMREASGKPVPVGTGPLGVGRPLLGDLGATTRVVPKGSSVGLMDNPLKVKGTGEGGGITTTDVAHELSKFTKSKIGALEYGKAAPEEMVKRAKSLAQDEARYQLAQNNTGESWYTKDMVEHDKTLRDIRPELSDPAKMSLFKMTEAVLSSGQKPYTNLKQTLKAWDIYHETGQFPETNPESGTSWGPRGIKAYGNAINMINQLVGKYGEKGASDWLLSNHPVRELREYNPLGVAGKADDLQPGVMVLGPKRGPFAQNLHGRASAFTADMWVARTWNRWMGTTEIHPETGEITTDSPRSGAERNLMKQSFQEAAKSLKLTTSVLQAVLWYYEQALYDVHGSAKESWNFADAAKRVAEEDRQQMLFSPENFEETK